MPQAQIEKLCPALGLHMGDFTPTCLSLPGHTQAVEGTLTSSYITKMEKKKKTPNT